MPTIKDIHKHTGLSIDFIRKCLTEMETLFKPFRSSGNNNAIIIDKDGMLLFDQIKQLKEQDWTIPQIRERLEQSLNATQTSTETIPQTPTQPTDEPVSNRQQIQYLLDQLLKEKDAHREAIEAKSRERHALEQEIATLKLEKEQLRTQYQTELKALPEGKTPEDIRRDWEARQRKEHEVARILGELNALGRFRFKRRRKLVQRLEALLLNDSLDTK